MDIVRTTLTALLALCLVASATPVLAAEPVRLTDARLDPAVAAALRDHGRAEAIVSFDGSGALARARAATGREAGADPAALLARTMPAYEAMKRDALAGVEVARAYPTLPTALVRFESRAQLDQVLSDPSVIAVTANQRRERTLAQSLPVIHQPEAAAAGRTGAGTAVAVLDSGVDYSKAAFGSCAQPGGSCKVAFARDFAPSDGQRDDDGHGTNVAGIVLGVAPSTKILALDVFDGMYADDADLIAAIDWTIANKATYGTRSVNMSLGDSSYHTTACTGSAYAGPFANLRAAGILPVVAAGNDATVNGTFRNGVSEPACAPGAIRVGATYDSNLGSVNWGDCVDNSTSATKITCFSQTGPLLSVLAPGSEILAAGISMSGTSQATPHVAGAVAVVGAAGPSATVTTIQSAIENNGTSITDNRSGVTRRLLDVAAAAAQVAGETPNPTPTPTPTPTPGPGGSTTTTGTLSGQYGFSSGYALYRYGKNVNYTATVTPAQPGDDITFTWQRRIWDGTWKNVSVNAFEMDASGSLAVYIPWRQLGYKVRYRLQASFAGNASAGASSSGWSYFRVV